MVMYVYNKNLEYIIKIHEKIPETNIGKNEKIISESEYHTLLLQEHDITVLEYPNNLTQRIDEL